MSSRDKSILIVDDSPDIIRIISGLLKEHYKLRVATNGQQCLAIATGENPPDLILLDVKMPQMDGYQVCTILKQNPLTQTIPVIFLTGTQNPEDEVKGLTLGAVDYLIKPIVPITLLTRIKNHLLIKDAYDRVHSDNALLEQMVRERTERNERLQDIVTFCMGALAESRDGDTGNHLKRTQRYIRVLAEHLQNHPAFADSLTPQRIEYLFKTAPLHDIGKVGIPDRILLKPGKLTADEFKVMQTHPGIGYIAMNSAQEQLEQTEEFLQVASEIIYSHHEKWDGKGYPQGLKGTAIPVAARLMAVADVYDALISKRVYKPAFSHEKAVEIIIEGRGNHFDPDVVDAFMQCQQTFHAIAEKYGDYD